MNNYKTKSHALLTEADLTKEALSLNRGKTNAIFVFNGDLKYLMTKTQNAQLVGGIYETLTKSKSLLNGGNKNRL